MKYTKSKAPLKVGSIVRYQGDNARLRKVVEINGDSVIMESYGRWTRATGLVPAKHKVRSVGILGQHDTTDWYGKKYAALSYCTARSAPFSGYALYHVKEVE